MAGDAIIFTALFESIIASIITDVINAMNGYKLKQNDQENEDFTVLVARGKVGVPEIIQWLEENTEIYQ